MASSDSDTPMDVAEARARVQRLAMPLIGIRLAGLLDVGYGFEESGPLPASKASIDAMHRTILTEEDQAKDCSICLDEICVGGEVTEMPCKHGFHFGCIEKWLKVRGSCPVCRFLMPVDDGVGGEDGRRRISTWLLINGDISEPVDDSDLGSADSRVDTT
uniref:RING-type E3 ubiquitin transferase n=1 Tax=Rhizophora mucronata TaxID=61149 RepID=A0A2P2MX03_RHIMU